MNDNNVFYRVFYVYVTDTKEKKEVNWSIENNYRDACLVRDSCQKAVGNYGAIPERHNGQHGLKESPSKSVFLIQALTPSSDVTVEEEE